MPGDYCYVLWRRVPEYLGNCSYTGCELILMQTRGKLPQRNIRRALLLPTWRLTTHRFAESDAIVCVIAGKCWALTNCISVSDDDGAGSCNTVVILSGNPFDFAVSPFAVQDCSRRI